MVVIALCISGSRNPYQTRAVAAYQTKLQHCKTGGSESLHNGGWVKVAVTATSLKWNPKLLHIVTLHILRATCLANEHEVMLCCALAHNPLRCPYQGCLSSLYSKSACRKT